MRARTGSQPSCTAPCWIPMAVQKCARVHTNPRASLTPTPCTPTDTHTSAQTRKRTPDGSVPPTMTLWEQWDKDSGRLPAGARGPAVPPAPPDPSLAGRWPSPARCQVPRARVCPTAGESPLPAAPACAKRAGSRARLGQTLPCSCAGPRGAACVHGRARARSWPSVRVRGRGNIPVCVHSG